MLLPLSNVTYQRLIAAEVGALLGTGLAIVALGLLAYCFGGASDAMPRISPALAIKMILSVC